MRDENRGCFLRLGVVDQEMKSYSIFIPKGRGERGGWFTMAEMLRSIGVVIGRRERKQDKTISLKPSLVKTFAEVVQLPRSKGR